MIVGAVASLVCMMLILNPGLSYYQLLALFFGLGLFTSTQVITYPMVAESNQADLTGTATGLASVLIMGGAGIAQMLFGFLLDKHWDGLIVNSIRIYSASNYQFAMKMFPIALIIGLFAIVLARETQCRKLEEVCN